MSKLIAKILKTHGPMLSGQIGKILAKDSHFTQAAIRQRISRILPPVHSLAGIKFKNNQRFLYLDSQFSKADFKERLIQVFYEESPSYANAIRALRNKGGKLAESSWLSACGSPVVKLSGHLLASTILERLTGYKVVEVFNDQKFGRIIQLTQGPFPEKKCGHFPSQRRW